MNKNYQFTKNAFERLLNEKGFPAAVRNNPEHNLKSHKNYGTWLRRKFPNEFNFGWAEHCIKLVKEMRDKKKEG